MVIEDGRHPAMLGNNVTGAKPCATLWLWHHRDVADYLT